MTSDPEYQRLHGIAAAVTGILIAVSTNKYADANTLIAGIDPADQPDALRQMAGLLILMAREGGRTNEEIRAQFVTMAQLQAADA